MRSRLLVGTALFAVLPSLLPAQRFPRPPIFRRPEPPPANLPPQPAVVANSLALQRSKWSFETAPVVTHMEVPAVGGGTAVYTTLGSADHADYRINDHYAATLDLNLSTDFGSASYIVSELGTRYRPLAPGADIRPYFDLRAGYLYMSDQYVVPLPGGGTVPVQQFESGWRFARGVGATVGTGMEYTLTRSLSLTTELSAMRSRMAAYHVNTPTAVPNSEGRYWMTSVRYSLGFKYNAVRVLHAMQQALH
ncbi:MAG TPA: hypothetical protein VHB25_21280 [Gemmatimonadaceae bacterium]|nr:hypothetical protein [Gemmatimonadaceae bacterium]